MIEVRRDNWWARSWCDELLPTGATLGEPVVRILDVPTYSPPGAPSASFGIERWQHLGGIASYAFLGFKFQPSAIGQLVLHSREIGNANWSELVVEAMESVKWTLAAQLGPGNLMLTHFKPDEVDTSVFSIASAACAAAFVATHSLDEIEHEADRLLLRPCQFEGDVQNVFRFPDSVAGRAAVPGLILSGPWIKGDVRVGDELTIEHSDGLTMAKVLSFPMIRYSSHEPIWHSIAVDVDKDSEIALPAIARGVPHWRPPDETPEPAVSDV